MIGASASTNWRRNNAAARLLPVINQVGNIPANIAVQPVNAPLPPPIEDIIAQVLLPEENNHFQEPSNSFYQLYDEDK